jgi:hypothetical protein
MDSIEKLRSEVRALESSHAELKIAWTFSRRAARRKFKYRVSFKAVEVLAATEPWKGPVATPWIQQGPETVTEWKALESD